VTAYTLSGSSKNLSMQNVRIILVSFFSLVGLFSRAQNQAVIQNYIIAYKDVAIAEMQRTGVPASIKLAQGIHETMAGTSDLVTKSNNHFGIKCKSNWTGESVSHDDDARGECFRKYNSPSESYRDHSNFLKGGQRYAFLFQINPLDYSAWAYGLKKAGYATNPKYPQVIIKLIEDYNLQDYTLIAMGKKPATGEILVKTEEGKNEMAMVPVEVVAKDREEKDPLKAASKAALYPSGEFKINDTKVVYATAGTPFLTIAQQHHIQLARLFEFNNIERGEVLLTDQLIFLQRKRKTGEHEFHIVKEGETLHDIAQEEGIRMESLLEYNQLEGFMNPAAGQQLYLKAKAPSRPLLTNEEAPVKEQALFSDKNTTATATPTTAAGRYIIHTVQFKETVYSISRKYSVRIGDIAAWNQLDSYELKKGQQLKIYK
jgi:LysM repeat protein